MEKKYSAEYKADAVRMVLENGLSILAVTKDLGIGKSTLSKWVRLHRASKPPTELKLDEREELRQLRAEVQKLKLERELLKKATLFFANDRSS